MLESVWREGKFLHCGGEYKLLQPLWRTVWRFLKKLKTATLGSSNPTRGIYPNKAIIQKDTCTPVLTTALLTMVKTWKQQTSTYRGTHNEMWYTTQWNITHHTKRTDTWTDREIIMSEVRLREISHNVTYMWNLKRKWYKWAYLQDRPTDIQK